jgi:hypothetical protein
MNRSPIWLAAGWLTLGTGLAAPPADAPRAMAGAMLNMMDLMGQFAQGAAGSAGAGTGTDWNDLTRAPAALWEGFSQGLQDPLPGSAAPLNGLWLSNTGERLWIRDCRFQLQSGSGRSVTGFVEIRDRVLAMYLPAQRRNLYYEYAEHQGRLALRDAGGQLFLYRRLNQAAPAAGQDTGKLDPGG